jgi:hypothetical protein
MDKAGWTLKNRYIKGRKEIHIQEMEEQVINPLEQNRQ